MSRDETAGLRAAQLRLGRLPGYVRRPDPARRTGAEGHTYKKGWEVRFTARSEAEIAEIRDLVVAAGFAPARPFFKGHQLIQPVYGMAAVQAYLAARQVAEEHAARTAHERARRGSGAARLRAATKAAHDAAHEAAREAAHGAREDPGRGTAERAALDGDVLDGGLFDGGLLDADVLDADAPEHDAADSPETVESAETVDHATADAGTGTEDTRDREHDHERERLTAAAEVAAVAGAAAAAAARLARRRAVEAFPAQLARSAAQDDRAVPTKTRNST